MTDVINSLKNIILISAVVCVIVLGIHDDKLQRDNTRMKFQYSDYWNKWYQKCSKEDPVGVSTFTVLNTTSVNAVCTTGNVSDAFFQKCRVLDGKFSQAKDEYRWYCEKEVTVKE